jgi:sugar lactone lactonase YvrE
LVVESGTKGRRAGQKRVVEAVIAQSFSKSTEESRMSQGQVELVADLECGTGENPLWCKERERLLFVDIPAGILYAYDPAKNHCPEIAKTRVTGGFTLQDDGSLLLFQDGYIAILAKDGSIREVMSNACPGNERFNDVIADPEGRVFAGTLGGGPGRLLRFDTDGRVTEVMSGIGCSNGMGFTPDLSGMYFTDSFAGKIYYFDYDRATGNLSKRRVFLKVSKKLGLPDGMTVDTAGYVWTALWHGARIQRYTPKGKLDREIFFPVSQTSSVTFGGPSLDQMYITSAAVGNDHPFQPGRLRRARGGGLYRARVPGISGKLPFRSKVSFGAKA